MTKVDGSADQATIWTCSSPSSEVTARWRTPFLPMHAPWGSTSPSGRVDRHLRPAAGVAGDRADHHLAALQLRDLLLHEPLDELRMRTRHDHEGIRSLAAPLDDDHLDVVADGQALAGDLLLRRQHSRHAAGVDVPDAAETSLDDGVAQHAALARSLAEDPALLDIREPLGDRRSRGCRRLPGEVRDVDVDDDSSPPSSPSR